MSILKTIIFILYFFYHCAGAEIIQKNHEHILCTKLKTKKEFYNKIIDFFKKRDPEHAKNMHVIIKNFSEIKKFCKFPEIILPPNSKRFGNINAYFTCHNVRQMIPVIIKAKGTYVVSANKITSGREISESDLIIKNGNLENLPSNVCLKKSDVINQISLFNILPETPITFSMFKKPWKIKFHQKVPVIVYGNGFLVISQGKILSNAFDNDVVNVAMDNGKLISGVVNSQGEVCISS